MEPGVNELIICIGMRCSGNEECERLMDMFFDKYCLSVTSVADPESTSTTTSNSGACKNSSRASASESDGVNYTTTGPIAALAVLSCLSVLLLAMVTTGWVCTCLIVKKREVNKSSQLKQ